MNFLNTSGYVIWFYRWKLFIELGLTGAGKPSFINAISHTESCEVRKKCKACTQGIQLVTFVFNNHRFNAIDTPGLDDSDTNNERINTLKNILRELKK